MSKDRAWNPFDHSDKTEDSLVSVYDMQPSVVINNREKGTNYELHPNAKFALIRLNGKVIIFNRECVGVVIDENETILEKMYTIPIYDASKRNDSTPVKYVTIQHQKLPYQSTEYFSVELLTIKEFMGGMYDYNSRTRQNLADILEVMNKIEESDKGGCVGLKNTEVSEFKKIDYKKKVITVQEASLFVGISERAIRQNCESKKYDARKAGGTWLINKESL